MFRGDGSLSLPCGEGPPALGTAHRNRSLKTPLAAERAHAGVLGWRGWPRQCRGGRITAVCRLPAVAATLSESAPRSLLLQTPTLPAHPTPFPQRPADATGRGRAGARLPGPSTYTLRDSHGPQSGSCLRATPLSATGAGRWVPPSVSPCASACCCLPQLRLQTRSSRAPGARAACGWQVQRYCQRPLAQRSTATSHRAHLAGRMLVRGRESALRCACLDLTDTLWPRSACLDLEDCGLDRRGS